MDELTHMATMKTICTPTSLYPSLISPPNSSFLLQSHFCTTPSLNPSHFPIPKRALSLKCSKNDSLESEDGRNLKDLLSGMVDDRLELLLNKEENGALLDGIYKATQRVEKAKRELAEIEKQEIEAKIMKDYVSKLESRASQISECLEEISKARLMVEEAERSLTEQDGITSTESGIDKAAERIESVKAALIAAAAGILAELPIYSTRITNISQLILPLAITSAGCALFGVTFRYALRRDLDNCHLKAGTSTAFGIVQGLGSLGVGQVLELDSNTIVWRVFEFAVYTCESLVVFAFAGVALDFCIKLRILSPYPIDHHHQDRI